MSPTAIGFLLIAVVGVILLLLMMIGRNGSASPTPTNSTTTTTTPPPLTIWERKYWSDKLDKLLQWSLNQKKFWAILGSWILLNLAAALMVSFLYFPWLQSFGLWLGVQVGFIVYASTDKIWLKKVVILCGLIGFTTTILGLEVKPWQSDSLAKVFKAQMKEKELWDEAKETARLLKEPQRSEWLEEVVEAQIEENLIKARETANIMAEPQRSEWLAEIYEIQIEEAPEEAKKTRELLAQKPPREISEETKIATETKFTLNNRWFNLRNKEVNPAELMDSAERWLLERQQVKAAEKAAEAKAKEEASWKGSKTVVAPVGDENWSEVVQLPRYFYSYRYSALGSNPDAYRKMQYPDTSGGTSIFVSGGPNSEKNLGPALPFNAKLRFQSMESEPLNILVQWR